MRPAHWLVCLAQAQLQAVLGASGDVPITSPLPDPLPVCCTPKAETTDVTAVMFMARCAGFQCFCQGGISRARPPARARPAWAGGWRGGAPSPARPA